MVIDVDKWKKCVSDEMKPEGKTAYGIKFSLDGSEVCLAGAVIPKDGKPRISLIARESTSNGIQWLADWINARNKVASCVVIDGRNGVDLLIDRIKHMIISCDQITLSDRIMHHINTANIIIRFTM